jgi:hypothetical protein
MIVRSRQPFGSSGAAAGMSLRELGSENERASATGRHQVCRGSFIPRNFSRFIDMAPSEIEADRRLLHASNQKEVRHMKRAANIVSAALLAFGLCAYGQSQSQTESQSQPTPPPPATTPHDATAQPVEKPQGRSAGGDIGSGTGDIGKGAAKGTGNLAKGTGKGAVDLVTLHPIDAAGAVGKGGASAGKNVVVGTAKGTGKIVKGTGKAIKHIF